MSLLKAPAKIRFLNQLPYINWQVAYTVALLVSAVFWGWLTWRCHRGARAGMVFWRASAWIAATTFLAAFLDNVFRAIEFLVVQIWVAGFFLFPEACNRLCRVINARTNGAPGRWIKRIADSARSRYQASILSDWTASIRSWWNGVPFRHKRLLQIAICVALLVYLLFFEKRSHS